MPSLLDQAIEVGKQLEGADRRMAAIQVQITAAEETLKARQGELSKAERDSVQHIKSEQAAWDQAFAQQIAALKQREDDVKVKEAALATFPKVEEALKAREAAVVKREAEATTQWQKAKQAELDWQERDKELDAKAAAINAMRPSTVSIG